MDKKDGGTIDLESLRGHTPGPWEYHEAGAYAGFSIAPRGTLPTLAAVERPLGSDSILNVTAFNFPGETKANARLIAAAPALLAELTARRARDAEVAALVDKADTAATVLSNLIAARQVDSGYSVYVTDLTSALLPFTGDKT